MGNNKNQLVVAAIENGTVIDHIPAEKTYQVVNLLQLEKMETPVTIGYNLPSKKIGKKGIIKVANKFFTDEEINRLSVVAPNIGLSIIKDYEIVEKKTVKTPDTLKGIVKCNNPKCITNNEPMATVFYTMDAALGIIRCHYCDKEQQLGKVELCK
jgi:aspartate carbamoyltransferase regulatory subunit